MAYKFNTALMGFPKVEEVLAAAPAGGFPAGVSGAIYPAEDPVWGAGEFVFGRANGTIRVYGSCLMLPVWDGTNFNFTQNFTEVTNTALLGRPAYIAQNAMTAGQFGWFQCSGLSPVNASTTSVTPGVQLGITAAGQIGTLAAGKALLNATVVTSSANTVVKASVSGISGDTKIFVLDTAGFFKGGYVAGTGVGAAAIITAIDESAKSITVSVANSAAVTGNVTQTANNATIFYPIMGFNRAAYQGPIT